MKTRVKLGHSVFALFFALAISSCNKEGFYEKDALVDPGAVESTAGVDGGAEAGVEGGAEGGVEGGVDGSTVGGSTDGSATGGSTTGDTAGGTTGSTVGGTDGSTTGGTTGSTVGGTDGSTTGGTDGSTTGGTDGSTVGGTNGSTTGGTDGSTTGGTDGSTTGGSTTGGSTTGSTTGGTTGGTSEAVEENFQQSASQTKKLDILWVVDNSGSMGDEQVSLGTNFDSFITDFITKDVDFKMAITTTDTSSDSKRGKMVTGSDTKLTSAMAQADQAQFMLDFKNLVNVGIGGSGYEKGLDATDWFMTKHAATWMRSDAYLAVVILSDEQDQSPKTPIEYANLLKGLKSSAGLVKVYTIVDKTNSNPNPGVTIGHERYAEVANETAGIVADIQQDFAPILSDMGDAIINLLDSFALAHDPIPGSLKVFVNNVETTNFTFDAASRSIKFDSGHIPPVSATIKVTYLK